MVYKYFTQESESYTTVCYIIVVWFTYSIIMQYTNATYWLFKGK